MIFISVIIPVYNKDQYIIETVQSVLEQSYRNFELVIIDDGSTDRTHELINSISDFRIKYHHQKNQGVSAARNKGISLAIGQLLALLDGDDLWEPDYLERIVELTNTFPNESVFSTAYSFKEESKAIVKAKYSIKKTQNWSGIIDDYFKSSLRDPLLTSSSIVLRHQVFDVVGGFPEGYNLGEDLDMWCRIALNYNVVFSMNPRVIYRRDIANNVRKTVEIDRDFPVISTLEESERVYIDRSMTKYLSLYCMKCAVRYSFVFNKEKFDELIYKAIKYSLSSRFFICFLKATYHFLRFNFVCLIRK